MPQIFGVLLLFFNVCLPQTNYAYNYNFVDTNQLSLLQLQNKIKYLKFFYREHILSFSVSN